MALSHPARYRIGQQGHDRQAAHDIHRTGGIRGQPPEPASHPRVEDELLAQQATSCLTAKLREVVTLRYGAGLR